MRPRDAHYLIGVDGGGTGCRAAVCSPDGRCLGQGGGGPANATTDLAQCIRSVTTAIDSALSDAGLARECLTRATAHLGLAGVMGPRQAGPVAHALKIRRIAVTGDAPTALAGALGGDDGALLAIGTGTLIVARHGAKVRRVGGWGLQVSDQASGAWLGRALLEQVLLCADGMAEHSPLTRDVLAGYPGEQHDIVAFAATARPADYGALAPRIVAAAGNGDAVGLTLMRRGAAYLDLAIRTLGVRDPDRLCLSGGVGPHYADLLHPDHRTRLRAARGTALDGAVRLARLAYETAEPERGE